MEKHFFDMKIDSINRNWLKKLEWEKSKILFQNSDWIPEWDNIKIFQWIFSQNFKNWEKSRNGYKYDQEGWFVDNYERLPIILWQHDDSYGWIWFVNELYLDTKGNLSWLFYVDLDMLEERNRKQVEKWFVTMVSTWAITMEAMFEHNESWKRYTQDEAVEEFWWSNVMETLWGETNAILTYVVTKAELVENSLVTIWSNYWAIAKTVNSIDDEMKTIANQIKSKQDKNILISKDSTMNLDEAKKEIDSLNTKAETLKNEISEKATKIDSLEKDNEKKETEINTLKDEAWKNEAKLNKLEDEAKDKILANVKIEEENKNTPNKTDKVEKMDDFAKKYSK